MRYPAPTVLPDAVFQGRAVGPVAPPGTYTLELAEVAPDRLLWGTDWPHGNIFKPNSIPNDGDLIDLLPKLLPDAAIRQKVLVDNPARLFGFDRTSP